MKRFLLFLMVGWIVPIYGQVLVTRGPYIQMATQTSIIIKWRTNVATTSRILYGLDEINLTGLVIDGGSTTEHELQITGLNADTKYYYAIGNLTEILSTGYDQFFYTQSLPGTERPYTFWVVGDCGSKSNDARNVRNAFQTYMGTNRVDGMIMLGDNAYDLGLDGDYQNAIFSNMYEDIVSNLVMWPTPGNHDYYGGASAATQTGAYYDVFTLPKSGELGGFPSSTEAYYSFNIGNVHFISIDSYDSGRDSTNAMGNWIKQDLANNNQEWTVAYWHHSPYTKGSHDSDNPFPWLDGELPEMREQILPLMENGGVDLILCGHSHSYERSYLIDRHYGNSGSFNSTHQLDNGSGDYVTDCPYLKNTTSGKAHKGTVLAVVGVSGKTGGTSSGWPHPAMYESTISHFGSMILTVNKNRLDAKFLTSTNTIHDQFTIIKNAGGLQTVYACQGQEITLEPSFPLSTSYNWMPGSTSGSSLTIAPIFNSYYYGADAMSCIVDTFKVEVIQPGSINDTCNWSIGIETFDDSWMILYPNPVKAGESIYLNTNTIEQGAKVELIDYNEKIISSCLLTNENTLINIPQSVRSGMYFIRITDTETTITRKIIIQS